MSDNNVETHISVDDLDKFMKVTGANPHQATCYLKKADGRLTVAVDRWFEKKYSGPNESQHEDTSEDDDAVGATNDVCFEKNNLEEDNDCEGSSSDDSSNDSSNDIKVKSSDSDSSTSKEKSIIVIDDDLDSLDGNNDISSQGVGYPYTVEQFKNMWNNVKISGKPIEEIEKSSFVKDGNNDVGTAEQSRAMYGRIKIDATKKIFDLMELKSTDVFIDIGHGIGSVVLQAAFTRGCDSRGIELKQKRNSLATEINADLHSQILLTEEKQNIENRNWHEVVNIQFKEGDFRKQTNYPFIIEANKILVNNAQEIFSARSSVGCDATLDDYIASIFARTKPGSIMVTLEKIPGLGRSRSEVNADRKSNGLPESDHASFFEHRKVNIGNGAVTWTDVNEIVVWVYERVCEGKESGFLCNKCSDITHCTSVIQADDPMSENISLLRDSCVYCGEKRLVCKRTPKCLVKAVSQEITNGRKSIQNTKTFPKRSKKRRKKDKKENDRKKKVLSCRSSPQYKTESSFNSDDSNESSGDEYVYKS